LKAVFRGTDVAYGLAIKHKVKVGWGTDVLFGSTGRQGTRLAIMTRWYTPTQVLKMATSDNADLLSLSGLRSPYQGKLGVIEKDAFADILLVDGDPTNDLSLIADAQKTLRIIMKDGRLHKNTL
jgi:imidazolonepropionase-like amidohydrolase